MGIYRKTHESFIYICRMDGIVRCSTRMHAVLRIQRDNLNKTFVKNRNGAGAR